MLDNAAWTFSGPGVSPVLADETVILSQPTTIIRADDGNAQWRIQWGETVRGCINYYIAKPEQWISNSKYYSSFY